VDVVPNPEQPGSATSSASSANASLAPDQQLSAPVPTPQNTPAPEMNRVNEFLDTQDVANRTDFSDPPKPGASLQPVKPAMPLPVLANKAGKPAAGPSAEALEFMAWLQKGVADGSQTYNAVDALVHFVRYKDEAAMLLVSPLIFRRFDEARGAVPPPGVMPGTSVQRAITTAGWHLRGPGGKNVVSYQVMRKGGRGGNLLNGFLVLKPEQFFNPVPQTNDRLVFWNTDSVRKEE
jgi:hypothetical protein